MEFEALSPKVRKALLTVASTYGWVLDPECKDMMTDETAAIKLMFEVVKSVHSEVLNILALTELAVAHAKGFEIAVLSTPEGRELVQKMKVQSPDLGLREYLEKRGRYDA
jgi:hypothetical protein